MEVEILLRGGKEVGMRFETEVRGWYWREDEM